MNFPNDTYALLVDGSDRGDVTGPLPRVGDHVDFDQVPGLVTAVMHVVEPHGLRHLPALETKRIIVRTERR